MFVCKLAQRHLDDDQAPRWASNHLAKCAHCQAEANTLHKVSRLVKLSEEPPASELSWSQVRSKLNIQPAPVRSRSRFVWGGMVGATAALAAAVFFFNQNAYEPVAASKPIEVASTESIAAPKLDKATPVVKTAASTPDKPKSSISIRRHKPSPPITKKAEAPVVVAALPLEPIDNGAEDVQYLTLTLASGENHVFSF